MSDTQPDPDADHIQPFDRPNIVVLLNRVMRDVQQIGKNETPSGGPQFKYRGVDTVVDAVGPILREHGVVCLPSVQSLRFEERGKQRHAIVEVLYTFYGPAGPSECVTAVVAGEASDVGDKATTQAQSVAYRELWLKGLCIPSGDPDPDSRPYPTAQANAAERPAPGPEVDPEMLAAQRAKDEQAKTKGFADHAQRLRLWAKLSDHPLNDEQAQAIMAWMEKAEVTPQTFSMKLAEQWKAALDEIAPTSTNQPTETAP